MNATSRALASFLSAYDNERKDIMVCNLPNCAENLLLQLSCNRLGVLLWRSILPRPSRPKSRGQFSPQEKGCCHEACTRFLGGNQSTFTVFNADLLVDLLYGRTLQTDFGLESLDAGYAFDL